MHLFAYALRGHWSTGPRFAYRVPAARRRSLIVAIRSVVCPLSRNPLLKPLSKQRSLYVRLRLGKQLFLFRQHFFIKKKVMLDMRFLI